MARYSDKDIHPGIYKGAEKIKTKTPPKVKGVNPGPKGHEIDAMHKEMKEHHKHVKAHMKHLDGMMKHLKKK